MVLRRSGRACEPLGQTSVHVSARKIKSMYNYKSNCMTYGHVVVERKRGETRLMTNRRLPSANVVAPTCKGTQTEQRSMAFRQRDEECWGRMNIGGSAREAFVLGKVRKWDDHTRLYESVHNKKHPELHAMLRRLIQPTPTSSTMHTIEQECGMNHITTRGTAILYCLALGDFTGYLRVFDDDGGPDIDNLANGCATMVTLLTTPACQCDRVRGLQSFFTVQAG